MIDKFLVTYEELRELDEENLDFVLNKLGLNINGDQATKADVWACLLDYIMPFGGYVQSRFLHYF